MEPRAERSETLDLPSLDIPELPSERRDFRDLWPAEGFQMPAEPFSESFHSEEEVEDREPVSSRTADVEVERPSKPTPVKEDEEELTRIDTLPEVITADMLRARKNKGVDLSADFVVPAELLVGMDDEEVEEEWDEDDDRNKGRGKAGPKAPAKPVKGKAKKPAKPETKSKGKKWRPPLADEEF